MPNDMRAGGQLFFRTARSFKGTLTFWLASLDVSGPFQNGCPPGTKAIFIYLEPPTEGSFTSVGILASAIS